MQNITLFSDKDEEKVHKLLDKNAKKSLGQLRSQTGESLGQNDNFPGVPGRGGRCSFFLTMRCFNDAMFWNS